VTAPAGTAVAGTAVAGLAGLAVKGRAARTGYARSEFGVAWTDSTSDVWGGNGLDTREDVLSRDLTVSACATPPTARSGAHCVVRAGVLHDPYTGTTIAFRRGPVSSTAVQIDHVVALSDEWQTGAQQLSAVQRTEIANDPLNLIAVDGPTNTAKSDSDAASWLPPNTAFRCAYVGRQIAVKAKYRLWVTVAEKAAMARVLTSCPTQPLPTDTDAQHRTY
jgi:hypothetical protein